MSAPLKPWETPGTNARASALSSSYQTPLRASIPGSSGGVIRNSLQSSVPPFSTTGTTETRNAPQLPARPQRSNYSNYGYSGMTGYGSMMGYGGYGSGGMYGLSSYGYGGYGGGYGGYGGGYGVNRYGMGYNSGSSFTRRAEESSRAAFQSIESIVQAFGSIAMMLESTHFAVINSFRAVLGVADHFSRLRGHLMSVLGAITLFRAIKNLFYKLLVFLRLRKRTVTDDVWNEAKSAVVASTETKKSQRSWPIVMFFGVVLGAPWLFWKLLQSLSGDDSEKQWMTGEGDHVLARAEYDFEGESDEELSFHTGDMLRLAPKDKQPRVKGWLLASLSGTSEGLIPANYVKILGLKKGKKQAVPKTSAVSDSTVTPEPVATNGQTQSPSSTEHYSCSSEQKHDPSDILPAQNLEIGGALNNGDIDEFGLIESEFNSLGRQQEQR